MTPELLQYILKYQDQIYIRVEIDGKWGSHKLSEVTTSVSLPYIVRWLLEGITPARMKTPEELAEQGIEPLEGD